MILAKKFEMTGDNSEHSSFSIWLKNTSFEERKSLEVNGEELAKNKVQQFRLLHESFLKGTKGRT